MNKITFALVLISGIAHSNDVVNKLETGDAVKAVSTKSKKSMEVGAGLYQMSNSFDAGGSEELQGTVISFGKVFIMPKNFKTKSLLKYSWADNERRENKSTTDSSFTHVVFNQSFGYPFYQKNMILNPYITLGYGIGNYSQKTKNLDSGSKEELGVSSLNTRAGYVYRSIGAGIQIKLENSIAPYLELESSTIAFDDVSTSYKKSGSKDRVSIDSSLDEISSTSLTLGVSYIF